MSNYTFLNLNSENVIFCRKEANFFSLSNSLCFYDSKLQFESSFSFDTPTDNFVPIFHSQSKINRTLFNLSLEAHQTSNFSHVLLPITSLIKISSKFNFKISKIKQNYIQYSRKSMTEIKLNQRYRKKFHADLRYRKT